MDLASRPACPPLQKGDKVIVRRSPNDMRGRSTSEWYLPGVVTKAGRVWLTIETSEEITGRAFVSERRMRRDTQNEGGQYIGFDASFLTPEQHEYDQQLAAVNAIIKDAKVSLGGSLHRSDEIWTPVRRAALADFIVSLGILGGER